jgi:hypothetical protein
VLSVASSTANEENTDNVRAVEHVVLLVHEDEPPADPHQSAIVQQAGAESTDDATSHSALPVDAIAIDIPETTKVEKSGSEHIAYGLPCVREVFRCVCTHVRSAHL